MTPEQIQANLAKQAAQAVLLFDLARRGMVPLTKLEGFVDPEVLTAAGPTEPPGPGTPIGPARIGGVRVQLDGPRRSHASAVAHTADGAATGYVLELARDGAARPWIITELSRVDLPRIVGPRTHADVVDRRTHRLPPDLSGLLAATEHARDQTAASLAHAQQHLSDALTTGPPHQAQAARRDVARWRTRLEGIDEELAELHDVQALRQMRDAVLAGDPIVSARRTQLEALLGDLPDDPSGRDRWRHAASQLLDYAATWNVANVRSDIHSKGTRDPSPRQATDRHAARDVIDVYQRQVAAREPTRGSDAAERPRRVGVGELQAGDRVQTYRSHPVLTFQGRDPDTGLWVLHDDQGHAHRHSAAASFHRVNDRTRDATPAPPDQAAIELDR